MINDIFVNKHYQIQKQKQLFCIEITQHHFPSGEKIITEMTEKIQVDTILPCFAERNVTLFRFKKVVVNFCI